MHYLASLTIYNFRSIKSLEISLSPYSPLIGYNNAGKSNICSALLWLITKRKLVEADFNDTARPVEVVGSIVGITDAILDRLSPTQRSSIEPYITNSELTIRRIQENPMISGRQIKLDVMDADGKYHPNPNGIDVALEKLFPEPLFIGATDNIEEEISKSKKGTIINRLVQEIVAPLNDEHGERAAAALSSLRDMLDSEGGSRGDHVSSFDARITDKLSVLFPDVSLRLHVPIPELKDLLAKGTLKIYPNDQVGPKDIEVMGSGALRSIQIALIRELAESRSAARDPDTCTLLIIDEPELYLHPQAIDQLRDSLKALSQSGFQIVFPTHSARLIGRDDIADSHIVRKSAQTGTFVLPSLREAIRQKTDAKKYDAQLDILFDLTNSSQILFSETVILCEGSTERIVLPNIFYAHNGSSLGASKIALIETGSVDNTIKCLEVLDAMGYNAKAIVDLDFAFRGAVASGMMEDVDAALQNCICYFQELKDEQGLQLKDKLPCTGGQMSKEQAYRDLASTRSSDVQDIVSHLRASRIWGWPRGYIEDHLHLTGKKKRHSRHFCKRLDDEGLKSVSKDYDSILALIAWMTE